MKVLSIYCDRFAYAPRTKTLDEAPVVDEGSVFTDSLVAFIQVEASDEEKDVQSREKKLVNHLKWVLRKNTASRVVLHSFAHLSDSKATPSFSKSVFDAAEVRLQNAGFETAQTPFGYFLDLEIKAPGFSLARIWAEL